MSSTYPGAIDALNTSLTDGTDAGDDTPGSTAVGTHAAHHNNLADAINKIEAELGINPSGADATVAARLDAIVAAMATDSELAAGLATKLSATAAAGGSLSGTYPNPGIAAGAVGSAEVASAIKDPAAGTAGLRTLGTGAAQAAAGNDSRLSDQRTPTDGSVTAAKVAAALKPSGSAAASDEALRALGTAASTAAAGNDSRLSDTRTPTDGSVTDAKVASGAAIAQSKISGLTSALAAKQDTLTVQDEGSGLTNRATLNFTGAGVTATDAGGKTVVTIPGAGAGTAVQSPAYAASLAVDASLGDTIKVGALTGNITIGAPSNGVAGQSLRFIFIQDSTGGRTVTWNAAFLTPNWAPAYGPNKVTTIEFIYDGTNWRQVAQTSVTLQWFQDVEAWGADATGVSDSTTAIQAAIDALPTNGGVVHFGYGIFNYTAITLRGRRCVILQGEGGLSAGAATASMLRCTATGSSAAINMQSCQGSQIRDLYCQYNSPSFTGYLVDCSTSTNPTDGLIFDRCYFGGVVFSADSSAGLFYLSDSYSFAWNDCRFDAANYHLVGRTSTAHFANAHKINHCSFNNHTLGCIRNLGQGWSITGACTFEPGYSNEGTTTVTIATPGVFTKVAHGLVAGTAIKFTTTGALPTGLAANTYYYVLSTGLTADNFRVSTTPGGSAVNTSGTQSGTHTVRKNFGNAVCFDNNCFGSGVKIDGNWFGDIVAGTGQGTWITVAGHGWKIDGNEIEGGEYPITLGTNIAVTSLSMEGNHFPSATVNAIHAVKGTPDIHHNWVILGNYAENITGDFIKWDASMKMPDASLIQNPGTSLTMATNILPAGFLPRSVSGSLVSDSDFPATPPAGTMVLDASNYLLPVKVGTTWAGAPLTSLQRVTALPASPFQGQEVILVVDAANGIEWHLRYDTNVTGSYQWVFIGGSPLRANVDTNQNTSSSSYGDLATVGPSVTLPAIKGVFNIKWGCQVYVGTQTQADFVSASVAYTGVGAATGRAANLWLPWVTGLSGTHGQSLMHSYEGTITTASDTVTMKYRATASDAATFQYRWLELLPVRVGL